MTNHILYKGFSRFLPSHYCHTTRPSRKVPYQLLTVIFLLFSALFTILNWYNLSHKRVMLFSSSDVGGTWRDGIDIKEKNTV